MRTHLYTLHNSELMLKQSTEASPLLCLETTLPKAAAGQFRVPFSANVSCVGERSAFDTTKTQLFHTRRLEKWRPRARFPVVKLLLCTWATERARGGDLPQGDACFDFLPW